MKRYRIKKEAVPFILEKYSTGIYDLQTWNSLGIDIKALEEVEPAFVKYGHKKDESYETLSGWSGEEGARFEFTIFFPSVKVSEYDKFSKGKITRELMNKIQSQINYFYDDFLNDKLS